jgi:toxin-antitoxin system PIN domain toxin
MFLPDINWWLALVFDSPVHHASAKRWLDGLSNELCFFCRLTQQGFLRLATNPKVFPGDAVFLSEAWHLYDTILSDPRFSFAEEPVRIETLWRGYTRRRSFSPKIWNDAYLAAFARAAGWKLVTFDNGFRQYKNLKCSILS